MFADFILNSILLQEKIRLIDALLILCTLLGSLVITNLKGNITDILGLIALFLSAKIVEICFIRQAVIARILNHYQKKTIQPCCNHLSQKFNFIHLRWNLS